MRRAAVIAGAEAELSRQRNIVLLLTSNQPNPKKVMFTQGAFTPIFTFATPGDLSVVYTTQLGFYTKIGRLVFIIIDLNLTPTHTTAAGEARIGGLPFASAPSTDPGSVLAVDMLTNAVNWNLIGGSMLVSSVPAGQVYANMRCIGNGVNRAQIGVTNTFPTATARNFRIAGQYLAAA